MPQVRHAATHPEARRPKAGGCMICGGAVEEFLDLGSTALANEFVAAGDLEAKEARYPLGVGFCDGCGHVQLTEAVPPPAMFEDYLYVSSASDTLREHLHELSGVVVERRGLGAEDLVIDIGANDGTLLEGFRSHGVRTVAVDPARNLAELAGGSDIDRYVGFFGDDTADEIVERWGPASAITATNTFPHIPDLHGFLAGLDRALVPGGVFVIEAHYLVDILDQVAFDTIYHEHVSYWSLGPMATILGMHGMEVVDAERLPIHHGQLRAWVQREGEGEVSARVGELLEYEHARGLGSIEVYREFADATRRIKSDLRRTIDDLRRAGKRVAGYGAPAKASTLLDYLELGPGDIDYIADRSKLKQGRYTPGTHIPIVPPERLLEDQPDYVVLLAWNFADEVMGQQTEYVRRGGRFILPVPEVRIV